MAAFSDWTISQEPGDCQDHRDARGVPLDVGTAGAFRLACGIACLAYAQQYRAKCRVQCHAKNGLTLYSNINAYNDLLHPNRSTVSQCQVPRPPLSKGASGAATGCTIPVAHLRRTATAVDWLPAASTPAEWSAKIERHTRTRRGNAHFFPPHNLTRR